MRGACGVVVMLVVAGRAAAQSGEAGSLAEQLFNQARELARAGKWVEACPKFEASMRYDAALGTRLNLATCYEHIDRLASAWALYRESIDLAKKAGDSKRRDYAQSQAAALEPRLAKLTITAPAKRVPGLVVTRDGTAIESGAFGTPLYVDAGAHELTATAPGFESFTQTLTIIDGKPETIAIPTLTPKPVAAPVAEAAKPVAPRAAPAPAPAPTRTYVALGIGAAGVVAVGVGLVFGAKASSNYNDATALCGPDVLCSKADYARGSQLTQDAHSSATISTVLVVGGSAAIVAGAIVLLTAPRPQERAMARLVPVLHDGGAGLALAGGF